MFDKLGLQRVQIVAICHAFDCLDRAAFGFSAQNQACADQATIHDRTASAAIARSAAFLGARQAETVTQNLEQVFLGPAKELGVVAIDCCGYGYRRHQFPLARV